MRHPLIVTLTLSFAVGCESLPELARDVCGNHVIEKNEDCDGAGIGENTCNESCRLTCTADLECPEGWGCGVDELCRQPSGYVEFFGGALALPADSLSLADFDGDGRSDVLASQDSTLTLAYVDSGGLLPNTRSLSFEPIDEFPDLAGFGDLNDDGTADLAVRVGEGVGVLQGSAEKSLLPYPFLRALPEGYESGDQLLLANIDKRSDALGDELLAIRSDGLYLLQTLAEDFPTLPIRLFEWSGSAAPFVTVVRSDDTFLPQETSLAGDGLLVAFPGGNLVTMFEPYVFEYDVMTNQSTIFPNFRDTPVRPPKVVALPAGATVNGPVLTGHFNWDFEYGVFDLFIPGELGGAPAEFLSFGAGLGFSSTPYENNTVLVDNAARRFLRTVDGQPLESTPFAIGQFDFDTISDFVDADGIVASGCNLLLGPCRIGYALGPDDPLTADYFTVALPEGLDGWTGAYVLVRDTSVLQRCSPPRPSLVLPSSAEEMTASLSSSSPPSAR
jgi:hypothetical protein